MPGELIMIIIIMNNNDNDNNDIRLIRMDVLFPLNGIDHTRGIFEI